MKYILSFFKPVTEVNNRILRVMIRGMEFQAKSWEGIAAQIEGKIAFYQNELRDDMRKVGYSLPGGNINGKWNPNLLITGNDIKNLHALDDYLKTVRKP